MGNRIKCFCIVKIDNIHLSMIINDLTLIINALDQLCNGGPKRSKAVLGRCEQVIYSEKGYESVSNK